MRNDREFICESKFDYYHPVDSKSEQESIVLLAKPFFQVLRDAHVSRAQLPADLLDL